MEIAGGIGFFSKDSLRFEGVGLGILEVVERQGYRLLRSEHPSNIPATACQFSDDGSLVASVDNVGVRFWDVQTATQVAPLSQPPKGNVIVCSSRANSLFLSTDRGIEEWLMQRDSPDGSGGLTFHDRFGPPANWMGLSRDGKALAFSIKDEIRVYDVPTRAERHRLKLPYPAEFVVLNPDGREAATWNRWFEDVHVWDLATSNLVRTLPARQGSVQVAFSRDARIIAIGDAMEFSAWDRQTWTLLFTIQRNNGGFWAYLGFSPDSKVLAIAHSRRTVRLLEVPSGQELATLQLPQPFSVHGIIFSPDGTRLAVPGEGSIQLWDLSLIRERLASMNLDWDHEL
jgi:WD40 repeat protein